MSKPASPPAPSCAAPTKAMSTAIPLTPGQERPVEKVEETYPYMRPRDAATLILVRMKGKTPEVLMGCRAAKLRPSCPTATSSRAAASTAPTRTCRSPRRSTALVDARLQKAATA